MNPALTYAALSGVRHRNRDREKEMNEMKSTPSLASVEDEDDIYQMLMEERKRECERERRRLCLQSSRSYDLLLKEENIIAALFLLFILLGLYLDYR